MQTKDLPLACNFLISQWVFHYYNKSLLAHANNAWHGSRMIHES